MDQSTVNATTEYKIRERLTRRKILNALLLTLEAQRDMIALDVDTQPGGPIAAAREFYEAQIGSNPQFGALIAALNDNTAQRHAIMLQAQSVDSSLFFGAVPALPE